MGRLSLFLPLIAACSFPAIGYDTGAGGDGGSGAQSTTSSSMGGEGGSPSTGGMSSNGGGGTSSEGGSGGGTTTGPNPCDMDGDDAFNDGAGCPAQPSDCNDENAEVGPQITEFSDEEITVGGSGFDYDCNGVEEAFFETACDGHCGESGFHALIGVAAGAAGCGQEGTLYTCHTVLVSCVTNEVYQDNVKQRCR